jgi:hypothetical protein
MVKRQEREVSDGVGGGKNKSAWEFCHIALLVRFVAKGELRTLGSPRC